MALASKSMDAEYFLRWKWLTFTLPITELRERKIKLKAIYPVQSAKIERKLSLKNWSFTIFALLHLIEFN